MLYQEIPQGDTLLISVRNLGLLRCCLYKLTERHDVYHPLSSSCGFSKILHGCAGQVNEGVWATGFSCVAVCNLQNNTPGFSISRGQITSKLYVVKIIRCKNLLSDVIKQIVRGIQQVE